MRKFWFAYLAKALVIFPGGFGIHSRLYPELWDVRNELTDRANRS